MDISDAQSRAAGLADGTHPAGSTAAVGAAVLANASGIDTLLIHAVLAASTTAVDAALLAGFVPIAQAISAPRDIDAPAPGAALVVLGTSRTAGTAAAIVTTLPPVAGGVLALTGQALFPTSTTAVRLARRAILDAVTESVSAPRNVHTQSGLTAVVSPAGSAVTATAVAAALLSIAGSEGTDTRPTFLTTAALTVSRTVAAILTRVTGTIAAPGDVDALACLTGMVFTAGAARAPAAVVAAYPVVTRCEGADPGLAGMPASRAGAVCRAGIAVLPGITGFVSTPGNIHALAGLAVVVLTAHTTGAPATVVAAVLSDTIGEHALAIHAGFAAHHTGTIPRAGVTILAGIADPVATQSQGHASPFQAVLSRGTRSAGRTAAIIAALDLVARHIDTFGPLTLLSTSTAAIGGTG